MLVCQTYVYSISCILHFRPAKMRKLNWNPYIHTSTQVCRFLFVCLFGVNTFLSTIFCDIYLNWYQQENKLNNWSNNNTPSVLYSIWLCGVECFFYNFLFVYTWFIHYVFISIKNAQGSQGYTLQSENKFFLHTLCVYRLKRSHISVCIEFLFFFYFSLVSVHFKFHWVFVYEFN